MQMNIIECVQTILLILLVAGGTALYLATVHYYNTGIKTILRILATCVKTEENLNKLMDTYFGLYKITKPQSPKKLVESFLTASFYKDFNVENTINRQGEPMTRINIKSVDKFKAPFLQPIEIEYLLNEIKTHIEINYFKNNCTVAFKTIYTEYDPDVEKIETE